jgi:hypothetical protein
MEVNDPAADNPASASGGEVVEISSDPEADSATGTMTAPGESPSRLALFPGERHKNGRPEFTVFEQNSSKFSPACIKSPAKLCEGLVGDGEIATLSGVNASLLTDGFCNMSGVERRHLDA